MNHQETASAPGLALADGNVAALAWRDAWRLQARLSNLLDADYQTVDGFNQPGRGAWLTLRYNAL